MIRSKEPVFCVSKDPSYMCMNQIRSKELNDQFLFFCEQGTFNVHESKLFGIFQGCCSMMIENVKLNLELEESSWYKGFLKSFDTYIQE